MTSLNQSMSGENFRAMMGMSTATNTKPAKPILTPHPDAIVIFVPKPGKGCWPNDRGHWRAKAKAVQTARLWARRAAEDVGAARTGWTDALVTVEYHMPAGTRCQQPDRDNLIAALKSTIDGLTDAGILAGDKGVKWSREIEFAKVDKATLLAPRVVLHVRPIKAVAEDRMRTTVESADWANAPTELIRQVYELIDGASR